MSSKDKLKGIRGPMYHKVSGYVEERVSELHRELEQTQTENDMHRAQAGIKELRRMIKTIESQMTKE